MDIYMFGIDLGCNIHLQPNRFTSHTTNTTGNNRGKNMVTQQKRHDFSKKLKKIEEMVNKNKDEKEILRLLNKSKDDVREIL